MKRPSLSQNSARRKASVGKINGLIDRKPIRAICVAEGTVFSRDVAKQLGAGTEPAVNPASEYPNRPIRQVQDSSLKNEVQDLF